MQDDFSRIYRNNIKIEDIPVIFKKAIDEYNHKVGIGNIKIVRR